jgi:hypothetical protein
MDMKFGLKKYLFNSTHGESKETKNELDHTVLIKITARIKISNLLPLRTVRTESMVESYAPARKRLPLSTMIHKVTRGEACESQSERTATDSRAQNSCPLESAKLKCGPHNNGRNPNLHTQ